MDPPTQKPIELWGGVECTVNRVGDQYFDQLERSGHALRLDDLDRFAELGIRTLRFPILWERLAPTSPDEIDWSWTDSRLQRLRELEIKPIAGLLHHGSGPRYATLTDPEFAGKLAHFAQAVAERYPWLDRFTPINEPLTTARFCALYGHWYPHARDGLTFGRLLLNQCRAVVLAMRAIRKVNPRARLVQTEDLGKTLSTPKLRYQADFENERRWLTWDLLSGTVNRSHPMWSYLTWLGIPQQDLEVFAQEPCAPDTIGLNYYVTSERFLDENPEEYPPDSYGGNGQHRYADVGAVRVCAEGICGAQQLLREAWQRYGLPIAVTEAHLGCTREEQLRWFVEVWQGAQALRREGCEIHAVTAWSLLGSFDWNSLLTRDAGHYEPGAYDLRGGKPRLTAVGKMIRHLARGENYPVLAGPGWWHRDVRLLHPAVSGGDANHGPPNPSPLALNFEGPRATDGRPLLVTGGNGKIAQGFARAAHLRGLACRLLNHAELDITDTPAVKNALETFKPWAVLNCAGFSDVDQAEENAERCLSANLRGLEILAGECAARDLPLVTFSSGLVFDGTKSEPHLENDPPAPLGIYGRSKALAEQSLQTIYPRALVLRLGEIFAPWDPSGDLGRNLTALARGVRVRVPNDAISSLTYLPDLAHASLDLLIDGEAGIWHLANAGAVTPESLLKTAAHLAGLDARLIEGAPSWSFPQRAPRPRFRALASERGPSLPSLDDALLRYINESTILRGASLKIAAIN